MRFVLVSGVAFLLSLTVSLLAGCSYPSVLKAELPQPPQPLLRQFIGHVPAIAVAPAVQQAVNNADNAGNAGNAGNVGNVGNVGNQAARDLVELQPIEIALPKTATDTPSVAASNNAPVVADTTTPDITTPVSKAELPTVAADTTTPDITTPVSKAELPTVAADTTTPDITTPVSKAELPTVAADTTTPDITTPVSKAELPTVAADTTTPDITTPVSKAELPTVAADTTPANEVDLSTYKQQQQASVLNLVESGNSDSPPQTSKDAPETLHLGAGTATETSETSDKEGVAAASDNASLSLAPDKIPEVRAGSETQQAANAAMRLEPGNIDVENAQDLHQIMIQLMAESP